MPASISYTSICLEWNGNRIESTYSFLPSFLPSFLLSGSGGGGLCSVQCQNAVVVVVVVDLVSMIDCVIWGLFRLFLSYSRVLTSSCV